MTNRDVEIRPLELDYIKNHVVRFTKIGNTHYYVPHDLIGHYASAVETGSDLITPTQLKCLDQITWLILELSDAIDVGSMRDFKNKISQVNQQYQTLKSHIH